MSKAVATNDAIYLHMEQPDNLMYISGVITFARPLDVDAVQRTFGEKLLKFGRFRQIPQTAKTLSGYRWIEADQVDTAAHFHTHALPTPGDKATLEAAISALVSTPLPRDKPLWDMHIFHGYDGGSALVARIHHSIGDGIALVYVMLSSMEVFDEDENKESAPTTSRKKRPSLASQIGRPIGLAIRTPAALERILTAKPDPQTVLKGELGIAKHVTWSQPIPLHEIKAIGKSADATINDLLLTLLAGTLRDYLLEAGEVLTEEIHVAVPVNVRPMSKAYKLGNQLGSISLALPILEPDRWERLRLLKQRMDGLKTSPELLISYAATRIIGMLPKERARTILNNSRAKTSALVSNVPGPRTPIGLAGQAADTLMFWGPLTARGTLGISIISYDGRVNIGTFCDKNVIPHPEKIIDGFTDQFNAFRDDWQRM